MNEPRILFRAPNWIGDAIMSTAALKELMGKYDKIFIGLREYVIPIFEDFEKKLVILGENPFYNARILKEYKFDIAFLFTPSLSSAVESYLSGIKERIGFPEDFRDLLLTKKIRKDKTHILDQFRDIVKDYVELKYYKPELPNLKRVKSKEKRAGIDMESAYGPARSWKKEGFKEIAEFLENKGFKIIQLGKKYTEGLTEKTLNLSGKTTLKEAINIISTLDIFISVDTGSMHIAAALGIPQIALYLSTSPEWTAPYYNDKLIVLKSDAECSPCFKRKCRYKDYHCREIGIELVKKKIEEIIE